MAQYIIPSRYALRGATAAVLAARNEVLLEREFCQETDTGRFKLGDGSTRWLDLPYAGAGGADLTNLANGSALVYNSTTGLWEASTIAETAMDAVAAMIAAGSHSGITFSYNDAGDAISATVTSSGGSVTNMGTTTVTPSAVSSIAISSLNLNTHGTYILDVYLTNATASNSSISLYYNSDTTATNYDRIIFGYNSGATITGGRANDAIVNVLNASSISHFRLFITVHNGMVFATGQGMDKSTTTLEWRSPMHQWRTTGTNVTGLTLSASVASSIGVNSRVRLWRLT